MPSTPSTNLPSDARLTTAAETPSARRQRPLYVTTVLGRAGTHVSSGQRRGRSNQSEEEGTPPFPHPSRSAAGESGTLTHLKKTYVPGAFTPSTFQ